MTTARLTGILQGCKDVVIMSGDTTPLIENQLTTHQRHEMWKTAKESSTGIPRYLYQEGKTIGSDNLSAFTKFRSSTMKLTRKIRVFKEKDEEEKA